MNDLINTDDMLTLFTGTPVMQPMQHPSSSEQTMDVIGNSGFLTSLADNIPVFKVGKRQVALQLDSGQQIIFDVLTGEGEELLDDETSQVTSGLAEVNSHPVINYTDSKQPLAIVTPSQPIENMNVATEDEQSIFNKSLKNLMNDVDMNCEDQEMAELNADSCKGIVTVVPINDEVSINDFVETVTMYKCRACSFSIGVQDELTNHLKQTHLQNLIIKPDSPKQPPNKNDNPKPNSETLESYLYVCAQCSAVFLSIEQCRDHMIKDHNMVFQPDASEENTAEQPQIIKTPLSDSDTNMSNISAKNNDRKVSEKISNKGQGSTREQDMEARPFRYGYKCKYSTCIHKFRSSESLALHLACHRDAETKLSFACSQCDEVFEKWYPCALHLWNAHGIDVDLFTCNICETYKTTTSKILENHKRIHKDDKDFMCSICGKKFKQKPQMRNHQVSAHKDKNMKNNYIQSRWYMPKKCEICFKTYADSKCLKIHMQDVHSKLRRYVCHVCGHSSARKAMWQAHLRQHTGEKPYSCTICNFKTGDHNSLRRHTMRHSGIRPYQCPHCSYTSIQSSSFKNHVANRHPGKEGIFCCKECSFSTVSEESFVQHLLDHKNNLIVCTTTAVQEKSTVKVFPENVTAAQLVYRSLGALPARLQSDVTTSSTSSDGKKQTITIEIPPREVSSTDDEDTTQCFLLPDEYDTGGITIPADADSPLVCFQ